MKRITFIITGLDKGGAERVVANLANRLSSEYKIRIIMLVSSKVCYTLSPEVEVIDLPSLIGRGHLTLFRILSYLRSYLKDVNTADETVVSFLMKTNLMVLLAGLGLDARIIISERNDPKNDGRGLGLTVLTWLLYRRASRIVFQTDYARKLFPRKVRNRGVIIRNPISINECFECHSKTVQKVFVTAGRLTRQKNHELLIRAFYRVHKKRPDYKLVIYGEGELRAETEALIESLGLTSSVKLPGNVDNLFERICDSQAFILSSDYEGQSNALLEAMALGLPVITTNCSGIDEIIDGTNGILIPTGDEKRLTDAMMLMIHHDSMDTGLGHNAVKTVKSMSVDKISHQWRELIAEMGEV